MPPKGPISLSVQNKNISTSTYRTLQIGVCPEHRLTNKILTLAPSCALAAILLLLYTFLTLHYIAPATGEEDTGGNHHQTHLTPPPCVFPCQLQWPPYLSSFNS